MIYAELNVKLCWPGEVDSEPKGNQIRWHISYSKKAVSQTPCNTVKHDVFGTASQNRRTTTAYFPKTSTQPRQETSIITQNWSLYLAESFPGFLLPYLWEQVPFWSMHQYWAAMLLLIRPLICLLTLPSPLPCLTVHPGFICIWNNLKEMKWWNCMNECFWQAVAQ